MITIRKFAVELCLMLAVLFMVSAKFGCAGAPVQVEVCGVHPTYGRVCAYWKDGELVIKADVNIPPELSGDVLDWLKGKK